MISQHRTNCTCTSRNILSFLYVDWHDMSLKRNTWNCTNLSNLTSFHRYLLFLLFLFFRCLSSNQKNWHHQLLQNNSGNIQLHNKKCNFNIVMINFMLRIYKTESHWRLVKKKIFHLAVSSHYFGGRQITFWFSIPRIIWLYLRVYVSGTMKLSVSNEWVKVGL